MNVLSICLIIYGIVCLVIGNFKLPSIIWNKSTISGFRSIFGDKLTQVFISSLGVVSGSIGVYLLVTKVL